MPLLVTPSPESAAGFAESLIALLNGAMETGRIEASKLVRATFQGNRKDKSTNRKIN